MARLLHISIVCFVLLALLCTAAIAVGRSQPAATFIPELQPCGDFICYLSIETGKTSWDDGLATLHAYPQLKTDPNGTNLFLHTNPDYAIGFLPMRSAKGIVFGETNLGLGRGGFSAGKMISTLGPPCYVWSISDILFLGYPNTVFTIPPDGLPFTPISHVDHIVLRLAKGLSCLNPGLIDSTMIYRWRGFTSYR